MFGQVCTACGLVQQDKREICVYYGTASNKTMQ